MYFINSSLFKHFESDKISFVKSEGETIIGKVILHD